MMWLMLQLLSYLPERDRNRQFHISVVLESARFVFIVDVHQPFKQQAVIYDYFVSAVWNDCFGKTARRNDSAGFTELFLNTFNSAIDTGSSTVDDSAAHTVNGIGADDFFWRIKTDLREL